MDSLRYSKVSVQNKFHCIYSTLNTVKNDIRADVKLV